MERNYEVNGKKLKVYGVEIDFNYNIKDVMFYNDIFIVLLDIPNDSNEVDNIFGINSKGKVIWRIENPENVFPIEKTGNPEFDNMSLSTYVAINSSTDGIFSATTFFAIRYNFDYKTGKLLKKEMMRW